MSVLFGCVIFPSTAEVTVDDFTSEELDSSVYDIEKYTKPFWEGNIVYNEVVFPIKNAQGEIEPFELMYDASEIVSVKSYTHDVTYTENVDYVLQDGNLVILPTGRISVADYEYIHRPSVPAGYGSSEIYPYYLRLDGNGYEYWLEDATFSSMSLSVTYVHNDFWTAPIPDSQEKNLPKTFERLKNGEELVIVAVGDSVTTGALSSGKLGIAPYADAYPEMTYKALCKMYSNDKIKFVNSGIGGDWSKYDSNKVESTIIKHSPDLVLINFGMNDSSAYRSTGVPNAEFRSNIQNHIDHIKSKFPDCEVLLISSLYGNRYSFSPKSYEDHAAILRELADINEGVGFTDPQRIQKYLIEETGIDYVSFTADNMVHPCDFGMRITAQCILAALSENDISEHRRSLIDKLEAYAAANYTGGVESKMQEIAHYVAEVEDKLAILENEREINELVFEAFKRIDFLIGSCVVHEYEDTVVPPMCDADGYTKSVCTVCGYEYVHSPVPGPGTEHIMDSGCLTTSPTYKSSGTKTYSCAVCAYTETESVPMLPRPSAMEGEGMMHISNDHNYNDLKLQIYKEGSGFVELDVCPISIEKYNGTPYVGLWISNYGITACYNFRTQRAEIIKADLPFYGGSVYAAKEYSWTSDGDESGYNWKKFAAQITGNTVRIYIDGELILQAGSPEFTAKDEVALFYTNGEMFIDNIRTGNGDYDPSTGTGGKIMGSWDFNSLEAYNDYFSSVAHSFGNPSFEIPNEASVSTGHHRHTHSGDVIGVVPATCGDGGYTEYYCNTCGEVYRDNYTDPTCADGHTLINKTVSKRPSSLEDGERIFECATCDMTFSQIIPKGTVLEDDEYETIRGDVNGDGTIMTNDLVILKRVISGVSLNFNSASSDVNGDGQITAADVAILTRIISGAVM